MTMMIDNQELKVLDEVDTTFKVFQILLYLI